MKKIMIIRKMCLALMSLFVLANPSSAETYSVRQVWSYKTRPSEENSKIIIVKIGEGKDHEKIFHIYVEGLSIKNPFIKDGVQDCLSHAPVSRKTLDGSVLRLLEVRKELPDYREGYDVWKKAFDKGEGGVFTIPVAEIIQYIEDVVNGEYDKK